MAQFLFGYSESEISPGRGITQEGYEHRGMMGAGNAGIRDPLFAQALSLTDGHYELLFLTLDMCEFLPALAEQFCRAVRERTGLKDEQILISASHTHSGPSLDRLWGARDVSGRALSGHDREMQSYIEDLEETLAVLAAQARVFRVPCRISGVHHSAVLGYNRRKRLSDRDLMLFSLWENPEQRPDGPYDPDIPVLMLERLSEEGRDDYFNPRGPERVVLFNPAFHPVVLGQHSRVISADYPGAARRKISEYLGPMSKGMFFLGASGDTHPFLATQHNSQAVDVMGTALGAGIVAALAARVSLDGRALFETEAPSGERGTAGTMQLWSTVDFLAAENSESPDIRVQTMALAGFAVVGISAECFTELGMVIKKESPFPVTLVATLSHGSVGYIPTAEAYSGGQYEVDIAERQGFGPGTLDELISMALEQLKTGWDTLHGRDG